MAKRAATPKQTAGGGFAFEDKVVGYYLVWMLSGTAPFKVSGQIGRIDCQVAADGWEGFDDLLITMNDGGELHRYALSLKSNLQFSKDAAPSALVRAAWNLLLHRSSEVMDTEGDGFGLVCVPHPDPPQLAIQSLLMKARRQTPTQLAERLSVKGYASASERGIHASCACPHDIATGLQEEDKLPGRILKRIVVIELDFENQESFSEATARFICSELTESGNTTDANNLWNGLCHISQRVRTAGGGITRAELIQEIRTIVELHDFPDFARDWRKLSLWRSTELNSIPDRVAGTTALNRDDVIAQIESVLSSSRFVAVVGASGTGKTVVAKALAQEYGEVGNVLWLRGERVRPGYVETLTSHHQLDHSLQEVLSNCKREGGLLVLDSGERLLDETDFAEMCLLLNMLAMHEEGCSWRLLVTCREEAWERMHHCLGRAFGHSIAWSPVRIDYPTFEMLSPVWGAFPALRTLAVRPHLSQVMRNLKVLDLLAYASAAGQSPDAGSWVGESQMIAWYWQHVVRSGSKGTQRDLLLQKFAVANADRGRFETLEAELSSDELAMLDETSHLLSTDAERGAVSFVHDLIADWARFRVLMAHKQDLASYCEHRFTNPHWHAALRLYGVSLLEVDGTGEQWKAAILAYPEGQDCFLESLVFAGNSRGLIVGIWPVLVADNGALLNAFLKRFQYVASIPNPEYMALAIQLGNEASEARTWERIPLWMYWIGVIPAMAAHREDLLAFAPTETARLARTWLRHTPRDWPGRQHAAALALGVAQKAMRAGSYFHHSEENARLPYTALIEAYPDQPEAVRELLRKAAARVEPTMEDGELFSQYEAPGTVTHVQSRIYGGRRVVQEAWPDGPLYRVDGAFRGACLETDALRGIMADAPDLAREVILSLLIERRPPKMKPDYYSLESMLPEDAVCLERDHSFYPRFYTRGPFLLFLRVNPDAALMTIIRLIDFATERWMESRYTVEGRRKGLDIPLSDGDKRFVGDTDVFHWYHGVSRSDIASSALMAVEKWLYECQERDEGIDRWVNLILESSQSLAFLGMLCEVGRYAPGLFTGPLRPLLLVPDTYYMETVYTWQGGPLFGTPMPFHVSEWFFNLVRQWDSMEHRKRRLVDIASYLFHRHKDTRDALLAARERWRSALKENDERWRRHTETLIATFDEENWKEVELPDGSKVLAYEEPELLRSPPEQLARSEKQMLLLTLPITCRKMIDEKSRLADGEITAFVKKTRDLIGFEPEDKESAQISPVANSLVGTIAVLFLLHRDWLRNNPDQEKWCLKVLDQVLAEPPTWPEFDMPRSAGNYDWEYFACEVAPVIWAEQPSERAARERIVRLALAKHYNAAGALLFRAFERRQDLGDGFWQLVNLLLEWSAMRWEVRDVRHPAEKPDLTPLAFDAAQRFLAGEFETPMPRWGERCVKEGKLWSAHNHSRYLGKDELHLLRRIPRIDAQQIQATFSLVFLPAQAADESERARFFEFWDQALLMCLAGTRFFDVEGNEITSSLTEAELPYDSDRWVLERLAVVVGQMRPEERPERYWRPILALGARAEHWVEDFLHHWFMDAKKSITREAFAQEWKRMIDFCLTSESWGVQGGRAGFHMQSLWMCLLGLPRFTTSLWQDEDGATIEQASEHFVKVSTHVLTSAHNAVHFLSWLTEASARGIRGKLLQTIADVGLVAQDRWWAEQHLAKVMARYLGLVWDEHASTFEQNAELKKVFLSLVHRAARTQEGLAMELQKRIAQRE
jgi:hypothetical protein